MVPLLIRVTIEPAACASIFMPKVVEVEPTTTPLFTVILNCAAPDE
jgi:hypothetical protein